jgi:hypothetical protein
MPIRELHRQAAAIVLQAAAEHGFALAGANALIAHGITDRFTEDVDLFTDDERGVAQAADAVEAALTAAGFTAERQDKDSGLADIFGYEPYPGLAEWIITAPGGEQMLLQLAYFDRGQPPVIMDIGPVLDVRDALGNKVSALATRAAERDYADVAAALSRYSIQELYSFALRVDPGLTAADLADAGRRLDRMDDEAFAVIRLSPQDVARLREQFAGWPRS